MATTGKDFLDIAEKRLKTVDILLQHREWGMAAYLMGFVLECMLKASACHILKLKTYPEENKVIKNEQIVRYFKTHDFEMLKIVAGVSEVFELTGQGASSWSGFTQEYTGNWPKIRYESIETFDEQKVRNLYKFLTDDPNGIIPLIKGRMV